MSLLLKAVKQRIRNRQKELAKKYRINFVSVREKANDEKEEKLQVKEYKGEKELNNVFFQPHYVDFFSPDGTLKEKINKAYIKLATDYDEISIDLFSNMFLHANDFFSASLDSDKYKFLMTLLDSMFNHIDEIFHRINTFKDKNIIVLLYSGGRDSTLLLLDALQKGYDVYIVFNLFNFNSFLYKNGYLSALFNLFTALFNLIKIHNIYPGKIHFDKNQCNQVTFGNITGLSLSQQPFNVFSISSIPEEIIEHTKEVWMGLIAGDDGITMKDEIINLYRSAMKFNWSQIKRLSGNNNEIFSKNVEIPPLVFPLSKISKEDILWTYKRLSFDNPFIKELLQLTCSDPKIDFFYKCDEEGYIKCIYLKYSECGDCCSCKHLKAGLKRNDFNLSHIPHFIKIYDFDKIYGKKTAFINKSHYKYSKDCNPQYQHIEDHLLEIIENREKYDKFFPDEKNNFKNLKERINKHLEMCKSIKYTCDNYSKEPVVAVDKKSSCD